MNAIYQFFSSMDNSFTVVKMLIPAFMAILFCQSGFDKILNYEGNLSYLTGHFKNSPLSKIVKILMPIVTFFELAAGILCIIDTISLPTGNTKWAFFGLLVSAIAFLSLFLGQRMAKDYAGAVSIAIYFVLVVFGLLLLV